MATPTQEQIHAKRIARDAAVDVANEAAREELAARTALAAASGDYFAEQSPGKLKAHREAKDRAEAEGARLEIARGRADALTAELTSFEQAAASAAASAAAAEEKRRDLARLEVLAAGLGRPAMLAILAPEVSKIVALRTELEACLNRIHGAAEQQAVAHPEAVALATKHAVPQPPSPVDRDQAECIALVQVRLAQVAANPDGAQHDLTHWLVIPTPEYPEAMAEWAVEFLTGGKYGVRRSTVTPEETIAAVLATGRDDMRAVEIERASIASIEALAAKTEASSKDPVMRALAAVWEADRCIVLNRWATGSRPAEIRSYINAGRAALAPILAAKDWPERYRSPSGEGGPRLREPGVCSRADNILGIGHPNRAALRAWLGDTQLPREEVESATREQVAIAPHVGAVGRLVVEGAPRVGQVGALETFREERFA